MTTITYTDREGGAPTISWHGREFTTTVPVEVDDKKDEALIEAAKGNAFFAVEPGSAPSYDETIVGRGEAAARDGKQRSVPAAYRGDDKRDQAAAWLFGFDKVPQSNDPYADRETTSPLEAAKPTTGDSPVSVTQTIQNDKQPTRAESKRSSKEA